MQGARVRYGAGAGAHLFPLMLKHPQHPVKVELVVRHPSAFFRYFFSYPIGGDVG